jgi:hypothetical protein
MTLLGKVFTVLIFIMSLVFMSFAVVTFATHQNWKMLVTNPEANDMYPLGLVHQLDNARKEKDALEAELEELQHRLAVEQAARRHAIGVLETKVAEALQRLSEKEAELRALQSAHGEAAEAAKVAQDTVTALRGEVQALRADILKAQNERDSFFEKVVGLTDQLHAAAGVERNLKERYAQLLAEISNYKRLTTALGLDPNMDVTGVAPPLDGIVTAVGENNLIEVSLGSDDGLRQGHRLEVFRANNYLGHAIVLKTDPDRAVAQVDEKSQRGLVKVRDRVATKLSRTGTG